MQPVSALVPPAKKLDCSFVNDRYDHLRSSGMIAYGSLFLFFLKISG